MVSFSSLKVLNTNNIVISCLLCLDEKRLQFFHRQRIVTKNKGEHSMGRHSNHDGKVSIQGNIRVTRSTFLASRRLTRSGKEFSNIVSPRTSNHAITKSNKEFQTPGKARIFGTNLAPDTRDNVNPNRRTALSKDLESRDLEEFASLSDDSEGTIAITRDVLSSDSRYKNLLSEIIKAKRRQKNERCVVVDISTSQICTQCSSDSRYGKMSTLNELVLMQPQKECCSDASLFRQRMKRSLSLALGVATPTARDSDAERESLVFNARKGISTKVYLSSVIDDVLSVMGTLACELVGEASYTCMQDSLLSGLMNEEIGEVCEKIAEINKRLQSLNNTVNDIVCEHLEDLYEADSR